MKIGMILDNQGRDFPPDIRVEKEIHELSKNGYNIIILSKRINITLPEKEYHNNNVLILRKDIKPQSILFNQVTKFNLIYYNWIPVINNFIINENPDVIHVHDFTILPTILRVNKKYGKIVIADLHENMPASLIVHRLRFNNPFKRILNKVYSQNYYIWKYHEKKALKKCDKIITVVPEASERIVNKYKIPENRVEVISNTENLDTFKMQEVDTNIVNRYNNFFCASYIGGIGPHRGIDTTMKSIKHIKNEINNFLLLIVGVSNKEDLNLLNKIIKKERISEFVEIVNWVPSNLVQSYIAASNVCLVPHNNFEHTNTTVPHKLFQYMLCEKPLLVSDCKPLKRIVSETNSGYIFKANDSKDLADKLIFIYNNQVDAQKKAKNGHNSALSKYSWSNDAKKLIYLYDNLK